jgi:hypothetical protein
MAAAAVLAAIPLAVVEHKPPARLAAAAASQHMQLGHLVGWAWVGITLALGLVLFILSSLASRGRGAPQGNRSGGFYPAPARSGRRAGRR